MTTNPLTTVGLMLTLASLVGSFFYIQLSQWLRDLLALRQKVELNKLAGDESQKRAIVESRVEYRKLASWHTYVVNFTVVGFVVFVLVDGLLMISYAQDDPLHGHIYVAFVVFLVLFIALSLGLMWLGFQTAAETKRILGEID